MSKHKDSVTVRNESGQVLSFDLTDAGGPERLAILRARMVRGELEEVSPETESESVPTDGLEQAPEMRRPDATPTTTPANNDEAPKAKPSK